MLERPPLQQSEQIKTPEKSTEGLYLDALEKKRDTLLAFHTMNSFRKSKDFEEMTSEELEQYKVLREEWRSKKENSFGSFENLSVDKQEELAAMGSRLYDVQVRLTLLRPKPTITKTEAGQESQPTPPAEAVVPETEVPEQPADEKPESVLTLEDVDDQIARLERSRPVPLLALEAWKAKKAELAERQKVEASPDRTPPKGFLAKVMDAYNRTKDALKGATETSVPTKKDTVWTLGFWKERTKGLMTPFGFLEFYRAEKFRRRTGEVAGDTEALATLIQEEKNLGQEEAQAEAREIINVLNEEGITNISAVDYERISSNITERKRKENDEEVAYIVKSAEDDIHDKLQKSGRIGEAGQELLTRENQLAIRSELMAALNQLRDGTVRTDRKELAKLIRHNLDEKWNWRYVWGGLDAVLWFTGITAISTKFLASKEAVAMGSKVAVGGAGSAEAAREFVETGMHENIWNTLKGIAEKGPGKFTPTDEQLKSWSQAVLDAIKHYEPEWVGSMIEGLKSSRTMPEGFSLKIPAEVMREMGHLGF